MNEKCLLCPVRLSSKALKCWKWDQQILQALMTEVLGKSKKLWTLARLFCGSRPVMGLLRSTQLPLGHSDTLRRLWTSMRNHNVVQGQAKSCGNFN